MFDLLRTPEIVKKINFANTALKTEISREKIFQGQEYASFVSRLNTQVDIYSRFSLQSQSLLSQINTQFSRESQSEYKRSLESCHGIFFFGFDNTIFNIGRYSIEIDIFANASIDPEEKSKIFQNAHQKFDTFYNAASPQKWKEILQKLRQNNFLIVLCTDRSPLSGEDVAIQKIIHEDLADYFDRQLFTCNLGAKGFLMRYIKDYISYNFDTIFPQENLWLVDSHKAHIHSATMLGYSTILSCQSDQIELFSTNLRPKAPPEISKYSSFTRMRSKNPDFIQKLLTVQMSKTSMKISIPQTPSFSSPQNKFSDDSMTPDMSNPRLYMPFTPMRSSKTTPTRSKLIPGRVHPMIESSNGLSSSENFHAVVVL